MDFVIDSGDEQAVNFSNLTTLARKAIEYCEKIPDGKLITSRKIAGDLKVYDGYLHKQTGGAVLKNYKVKHKGRNLYGNPRTIAAYRREVLGESDE